MKFKEYLEEQGFKMPKLNLPKDYKLVSGNHPGTYMIHNKEHGHIGHIIRQKGGYSSSPASGWHKANKTWTTAREIHGTHQSAADYIIAQHKK